MATDPLALAAIRYLDAQRTSGPLVAEAESLAALTTLYHERNRALWTNSSGFTDNARKVIAELARADDWGLDKLAYAVPTLTAGETSVEAIGALEATLSFTVLKYAWHARGGRIDPTALSLWLDARPRPIDVAGLLTRIAARSDPAEGLRKLHPQHRQFELLRQAYLKARGTARPAETSAMPKPVEAIPPGPLLTPGMSHAHVAIVRRRLGVAVAGNSEHYDAMLARAVRAYLKQAGLNGSTIIGAKARFALNAGNRPVAMPKLSGNEAQAKRILANMERWRWLPEDLGRLHVWNNLPEFETRVIKDGEKIHQERIVIGKPETQTPVFSDAMRVVVFHPDWGVPNSIKIKDLLPKLQSGDEAVLERRGMRILANGKTIAPGKFDWDRADIRTVSIVQDPGSSNPLGQIKFLFPNKHDVYMHDTPTKHLFNASTRMFSHGCIRVRNPKRLAEIVFGEDQGWDAGEIGARLKPSSQINNRVPLQTRIPVHNTYFTMIADENGGVRTLDDIYGHDRRVTAALDGVPAVQIAQYDPARKLARDLREIMGDPGDAPAAKTATAQPRTTLVGALVLDTPPQSAANVTPARASLGGPVRFTSSGIARPSTVYVAGPAPRTTRSATATRVYEGQ